MASPDLGDRAEHVRIALARLEATDGSEDRMAGLEAELPAQRRHLLRGSRLERGERESVRDLAQRAAPDAAPLAAELGDRVGNRDRRIGAREQPVERALQRGAAIRDHVLRQYDRNAAQARRSAAEGPGPVPVQMHESGLQLAEEAPEPPAASEGRIGSARDRSRKSPRARGARRRGRGPAGPAPSGRSPARGARETTTRAAARHRGDSEPRIESLSQTCNTTGAASVTAAISAAGARRENATSPVPAGIRLRNDIGESPPDRSRFERRGLRGNAGLLGCTPASPPTRAVRVGPGIHIATLVPGGTDAAGWRGRRGRESRGRVAESRARCRRLMGCGPPLAHRQHGGSNAPRRNCAPSRPRARPNHSRSSDAARQAANSLRRQMRKQLPAPSRLSTSIQPPCSDTMPWATERPRPVPSPTSLVV